MRDGGAVSSARILLRSFRSAEWFSSKVPPILAVGYGQVLAAGAPVAVGASSLAAILASTLALGALGYVVNDFSDSAVDERAGRPNRIRLVPTPAVVLTVAFLAAMIVGPIVAAGAGSLALTLVSANAVIAIAYSVPPIRLKERGLLGVVADSLGVHALPAATACALLDAPGTRGPAILAVSWALLAGIRGILLHQIWDRSADRASGVRTFASAQEPEPILRMLRFAVFPGEVLLLVSWLWSLAPSGLGPGLVGVLAAHTAIDGARWWVWGVRPDPAPEKAGAYVVPAGFYQAWLPASLAVVLVWRSMGYAAVAAVHLLMFRAEIRLRASELGKLFGEIVGRISRSGQLPGRRDGGRGSVLKSNSSAWKASVRPRVVVATSYWTLNGVNIFSANLVRGLRRIGFDAELLLTEERTNLVTVTDPRMPVPDDLPVAHLPVSREASWGAHWGAMLRYLEERAPCVYVPNADWRHSCISPLLSDGVAIAGVVHSDDPLHYDHVRRLGRSWNAIVTVSRAVAGQTALIEPEFTPRLVTIPIGVELAETLPERTPIGDRPLRVVYHGLLNQRQKRILDLVGILDRLDTAGIRVQLTLAGGGHQEPELRELLAHHVQRGTVRFAGVLPNPAVLRLLEEHDVFLMTSEFEGMPNALVEAMGRGCIPVVSRIRSGLPELVHDGENGFMVPVGDLDGFSERLSQISRDAALCAGLARKSFEAVKNGSHDVVEMTRSWADLCTRVASEASERKFVRPRGAISPPPPEIDGLGIFPVPCPYVVPGLGAFPSRGDHSDFEAARRAPSPREVQENERTGARRSRIRDFRVVVALPYWTLTGVSVFTANLVRGLRSAGVDAEILLTEERTDLVTIPDPPMPLPSDVPVRYLPVGRTSGWGTRWAVMQRVLEEGGPCVYLPNYDWRQSCVAPRLSRRVCVVGVLHGDDPLHYDHLARQGAYWDGIVAVSREIAEKARDLRPDCAGRLVTIPYGLSLPKELLRVGRDHEGPLRLVYHGVLNVRQKRILDLPLIVRGLLDLGIDVQLSVFGGGPDEGAFRDASKELVARGAIRMLGVVANEEAMRILESQDVYLMTSSFEGLPNALLEAMGRGCIPVVSDIRSGVPELVHDGVEGFVVPIGDIDAFVERIVLLARDPSLRQRMSLRARETVFHGSYRIENMVDAYLALFQRVLDDARRGVFRRPRGPLNPPPASVEGVNVFPVECVESRGLGRFPRYPAGQEAAYRMEVLMARLGRLAPGSERTLRRVLETPLFLRAARRVASWAAPEQGTELRDKV